MRRGTGSHVKCVEDRVIELYNAGELNVEDIIGQVNISIATLYAILKRNGVEKRGQRKLPHGYSMRNYLIKTYQRNARVRGLDWNISKEHCALLMESSCFYCDVLPAQVVERYGFYGAYIYNGIDRYDNAIGYTAENCVPCCWSCNENKGITHGDQFITYHKEN